jgi:serine/threonine-protein kinase
MPVTPGARLGAYEMLALIGAGGMGEVYRARDTKLGRPVAIKVLLAAVALDAERIARFEREAKLLAALNHPHIAALYGMEEAEGQQFLVMELVEGETLAERLARGALPVEAAVRIALQIADALEAAHEKGIIHRDLKPANIKITPDDRVKVLDFGLARAADVVEADGQIGRTHSPTLSLMATQAGLILGTAAYMSPEQAKGLQADHRSDVFSFGCVLYEMLTGAQAFQGDSVPDILASVLAREPDVRALPPSLNARLTELLQRCLDKNPKRRYQALGDLRVELETIAKSPRAEATPALSKPRSVWGNLALFAVPAVIVGAAIGALLVRPMMHAAPARIVRTTIATSGNAIFGGSGVDHDVAITPDGSRVVYVGNNGTQLFVRALDSLEPIAIATGRGVRGPFVSPDGQWVGFFDAELRMMKVPITGGPAIPIVERIDGAGSRGASWGPDDTIVFATTLTATGLQQVSASGGPVKVVTRPDRNRGETDHLWPHLLPGGAVLFTVISAANPDSSSIAVLDFSTGKTKTLVRGGQEASYIEGGRLVYAASGTLRAISFDPQRLEVRGAPVPVLPRLVTSGTGGASFALSNEGTLAYVDAPGDTMGPLLKTLVWIDRAGKIEDIRGLPPHVYRNPRISPDGTRIAVAADDQQRDIWIWDIRRAILTRLTMDPAVDTFPVWTHDSSRIVFASARDTNINVWQQSADGTGSPQRLLKSANIQIPTSITPDGGNLIFHEVMVDSTADLMKLPLIEPSKPVVVLQTKSIERNGAISLDGRWLAYESNSSSSFGSSEIFVRTFGGGPLGQWQVSADGGTRPVWGRNELFYLGVDGSLMSVAVPPGGASWNGGTPTKLLDRLGAVAGDFSRDYDVSPDGRRFVVVRTIGTTPNAPASSLIVVQHFDQEVASKVPTK